MVIKTFNIDEEAYKQFSAHCKKNGISMSKRVENFIRSEITKVKGKNDVKNETVDKKPLVHTFSKYC
ncbi:hypothetical protein FJZ21_00470 [Candidatus Pacearchaeota archaeon]|nr:hypothetical protein [Candidatus Pacearchaeota archaeon]